MSDPDDKSDKEPTTAAPSSDTTDAPADVKTETPSEEPAKAEATTAKDAEPAKTEITKTEPAKAEPAETPAPSVETPKTETLKTETPKPEMAAPELVKAETVTAEAIKAEPAKPDLAPPVQPEPKSARPSFFQRRNAKAAQAETPPAPPPKKKKKRRDGALSAASGFLSFALVAAVAGAFGVIAVMHKLKEPGPLKTEKVVYFPPRSDVPEMMAQLQREGVIDSPNLMNVALLLEGSRGKVKPGEYLFKQKVSLREIIDELVAGRQVMHSVTIPEGLTSEQIIQRLKESDMLAGDVAETPKEGALLPETYKFPRGFPRARLISKMQEDQRKMLNAIWANRAKDLPLRSPYELVTLASIVEKETGKTEERPHVAAVFVNRLRKGMRLQSDPTIVYGLVGGKASLGRGIMRSEIEKYTPYNTYAIDGLPPGPIANPGRAALEATAHPAESSDLYFVADGTGGHVFAPTLEQHSRNVQQWRRIEKEKAGADVDKTTPAAAPPATPKNDKRTQAPMGRLVSIDSANGDYTPGKAMRDDDGATHRLGKYSPALAAFLLGGADDPTADAAPHLAKLRTARAFFTEGTAPLHTRGENFDPSMLAANEAPPPESEEDAAASSMGAYDVARESADGRALPEEEISAYPVSPARRAEQKARAAKLGLSPGTDEVPREAVGEKMTAENTPVAAPTAAPAMAPPPQSPTAYAAAPQPMRPRAFDASEGTALDPLRDKSWDLTSAKTIPTGSMPR